MNKIEENMIESMSDTIDNLRDELSMSRQDYEALLEEVLDFFKKVKGGQDIQECVEEFEDCLSIYCNIEIDEEVERYESNQS